MTYELGGRSKFPKMTGGIAWRVSGIIEGVLAWARDEATGEYVRVYEVSPDEWVDGEPQSWSSGNFGSVQDAKRVASKAYRWLNRRA